MKKIFSAILVSFSLLTSPMLLAEMVNINKASAAVLQENLKGVGEKKAKAIVAYRKEHGDFKTLEEIMEVKGIGKGVFKKIKTDISLDKGATDLAGKAGATGQQGSKAEKKTDVKKDALKPVSEKKSKKETSGKSDKKTQ